MGRYDIADWSPADFLDLTTWFGERWHAAFPAFTLLTCKWRPEDLIPGLSDIDARIICNDVKPEDWVRLDEIVSRTHLEVTQAHPEWARKLEHLPGVCATMSELFAADLYEPELRDWDYYWGDRDQFNALKQMVAARSWGRSDEYYYLAKRFVPWCTPYNRAIDPPINIPTALLPKYALHSRVMHYFVPCIKAALAVINRDSVTGKREALYRWSQLRPDVSVLRESIDLLDCHYEVPWLEDEQAWYAFEDRLWAFIREITPRVLDAVTIVDLGAERTVDHLRRALRAFHGEPLMALFDAVRFSRIRAGRWRFYLNAPAHFDPGQIYVWEMRWLQGVFTSGCFEAYSQWRWGEAGLPLEEILSRLTPTLLDAQSTDVVRRVFSAAAGPATAPDAGARLAAIVDIYGDYYLVLERLLADARRHVRA